MQMTLQYQSQIGYTNSRVSKDRTYLRALLKFLTTKSRLAKLFAVKTRSSLNYILAIPHRAALIPLLEVNPRDAQ